jgi:hypothetical protein
MGCNIIYKCRKDSIMLQNPFHIRFLIHPSYIRKEGLVVFNEKLVSKIIGQHCRLYK